MESGGGGGEEGEGMVSVDTSFHSNAQERPRIHQRYH